MKKVIENIKTIRKTKQISREHMATELGVELSSYGKIERNEVGLTLERLYAIAEIFNMDATDILSYGKETKGNITYIPIKAQAGNLVELASTVYSDDYSNFSIPMFQESGLFMINVEGDSMYPTFSNGDFIIIKQVEDLDFIKYGEPFVVDAVDGRVLKRIHSHDRDDVLVLKSDNDIYEPYLIKKESINSVWQVRGVMTKSFVPKNFYEKRLQVIESNLSQLSSYVKTNEG
jgi:transcriptional regulator with XRE-family HTH domain